MNSKMFKGIAHLKVFNELADGSLELHEERVQNNIVTIEAIKRLLTGGEVFGDTGINIGISTDASAEDFERTTLGQLYAVGDPALTAQGYLYTPENPGVDPANVIYANRFTAPTVARTIESIGMVVNSPNQNLGGTGSATCYTYLKLASSLAQATNQVLEITYKLFIDWQNVSLDVPAKAQKVLEDLFLGYYRNGATATEFDGVEDSNFYTGIITPTSHLATHDYGVTQGQSLNTLEIGRITTDVDPEGSNDDFQWADKQGGRMKFRATNRRANGSTDGFNFTGLAIRGVTWGWPNITDRGTPSVIWNPANFGADNENLNDWYALTEFNKNTNLSNVYSHSADATTFFYDGNKLANSSWKPVITEDSSTNFPTSYIIKVTTSGGVGVGEYKIYSTSFDNTYCQENYKSWGLSSLNSTTYADWHPFVNNYMAGTVFDAFDNGYDDFIYSSKWIYTWSDTQGNFQFFTYQKNKGLSLIELTDRSYDYIKLYKLGDYPAIGAEINDLAVSPSENRVYIASEGGLHYIDTTNDTLTTLNGDRCLSVDVGFGNAVVAVFGDGLGAGRLSSSFGATWATALDLTGATVTWDNVSFVKIDPDSSNYELCIAEGYGPKGQFTLISGANVVGAFRYHWWSNAANWDRTDAYNFDNASNEQYHEEGIWPTNNSIAVKEGLWIYPGLRRHLDYWGPTNYAWNSVDYPAKSGLNERDIVNDMIDYGAQYSLYKVFATSSSLYGTLGPAGIAMTDPMGGGDYVFASFSTVYGTFESEYRSFCGWLKPKLSTDGTSYSVMIQMGAGTLDPPGSYSTGTNYILTNRTRHTPLYKFDINETSPSITLNTDYGQVLDNGSAIGILYGPPNATSQATTCNWVVTNEKHILGFSAANDHIKSGSVYQLTNLRNPEADLDDWMLQAYEWNGSAWIKDDDNTGPGRPLHTSTETLVQGLSISWTDLQPGDSQDLIADQYYTFVRTTTPGMIVVDEFTPLFDVGGDLYIRPIGNVTGESVAPNVGTGQYFVNFAPSGLTADADWLTLPYDNEAGLSITINGSPAVVIYDPSTTVTSGEVHITDPALGELYFNLTDAAGTITMDYFYLKKFDDTEVL